MWYRELIVTQSHDSPITRILASVGDGDADAHERLWLAVYDELHRMAQHQMASESPGRTLQPTALVHEAYFRLFGDNDVKWANRRHFFAAAAKAMRRIRVDDARKRKRIKRGGGETPVAAEDSPEPAVFDQDPIEVLTIDEALTKLEEKDAKKAQIVNLRYFAGLSIDETAAALGVSPRTIDTEWRFARAWLHRELGQGDDE